MGIIVADLFLTLDGVYQAPGGPDEDTEGAFAFGGWQGAYSDDEVGAEIVEGIDRLDALLLGRKTYDIFASYWPHFTPADNPIAAKFNAVPKFVVSRTLQKPSWAGTTVLADPADMRGVKDEFDEIHTFGSGNLLQTLLAEDLVDQLNLLLYPVTFGTGKRFLGDRAVPAAFTLARPARTYPSGTVGLLYERAGDPVTGITIAD